MGAVMLEEEVVCSVAVNSAGSLSASLNTQSALSLIHVCLHMVI